MFSKQLNILTKKKNEPKQFIEIFIISDRKLWFAKIQINKNKSSPSLRCCGSQLKWKVAAIAAVGAKYGCSNANAILLKRCIFVAAAIKLSRCGSSLKNIKEKKKKIKNTMSHNITKWHCLKMYKGEAKNYLLNNLKI